MVLMCNECWENIIPIYHMQHHLTHLSLSSLQTLSPSAVSSAPSTPSSGLTQTMATTTFSKKCLGGTLSSLSKQATCASPPQTHSPSTVSSAPSAPSSVFTQTMAPSTPSTFAMGGTLSSYSQKAACASPWVSFTATLAGDGVPPSFYKAANPCHPESMGRAAQVHIPLHVSPWQLGGGPQVVFFLGGWDKTRLVPMHTPNWGPMSHITLQSRWSLSWHTTRSIDTI